MTRSTPQRVASVVKLSILSQNRIFSTIGRRQIQQMLGYASILTTEHYLEPMRSLQVTAGDFIQIELALATE